MTGSAAPVASATTPDGWSTEQICRQVVWRYYPPSGMDRDDMMQEARIGAWQAERAYHADHGTSLETFVRMCATREVINAIRKMTRLRATVLSSAVAMNDEVDGSSRDDPYRCVANRQHLLQILEMITTCSPFEQRCFVSTAILGMPYAMVGEPKTVDNACHRVRCRLKSFSLRQTWEVPR